MPVIAQAPAALAASEARLELNDSLLRYYAGRLLEAAQRTTEALEAYEEALALDPELADAHYRLGGLCEQLGEPQASTRHFRNFHRLVARQAAYRLLN